MIALQFVLGHGVPSRAIAWFSSGHFSHVDAIERSGKLYGARSDVIEHIPAGVQSRPPFYEAWKERVVLYLPSTPEQERDFWTFNYAQRGKPYDKTAIWGFVAGRDWREDDSWYCSELHTAALETAGRCPDLYAPRNKVTPAALATVASALGATV